MGVGGKSENNLSLFWGANSGRTKCLYLLSHVIGRGLLSWYKFSLCNTTHPWTQVILLPLSLSTRITSMNHWVLRTLNSRRQMGGLNFLLGVYLFFHFSCIVFNFITVCVYTHRCLCTIAYQWRPEGSSGAGPLLLPWMELRSSNFGSKPFYFLSPLVNPENIFKSPKITAKE